MELQVALRLVPESKTFVNILKTEDENYDTLKENMQMLVSLFVPFQRSLSKYVLIIYVLELELYSLSSVS